MAYRPCASVVVAPPNSVPTNTPDIGRPASRSVIVPLIVPVTAFGCPKSTVIEAPQKIVMVRVCVWKPAALAVTLICVGTLSVPACRPTIAKCPPASDSVLWD